ncbi:hypothetical protein [Streptomyces sp. NPDC056061]|uniref:hypothetical protein n=1 Tax=Streptomyces sp. NPDC056061 TaxID=3345700 RepID=UPI0035DBDE1E
MPTAYVDEVLDHAADLGRGDLGDIIGRPQPQRSDGQDRPIGALSATAPGTVIEQALDHGYSARCGR